MKVAPFSRIVVLGHTGFIGGHLMQHLELAFPDVSVVGRAPTSLDLTIADDARSLSDVLDDSTAVVMLAAAKRQFGDTIESFVRNTQMVINLGRLLEERPVRRLIYFSSAAVYGEDVHNTAITEETGVWPTSYYGAAKFSNECVLRKVFARPGRSLLCVRPPLIYGAGDEGETYGPSGFVRAAIRQSKVTLWGDGKELREFIYVGDLVRIVEALLSSDATGVVNIASGKSHSFREALDIASSLAASPIASDSRPRSKSAVDNAFRNDRLLQLVPGLNFTPLDEGMRAAFEADRRNVLQGNA